MSAARHHSPDASVRIGSTRASKVWSTWSCDCELDGVHGSARQHVCDGLQNGRLADHRGKVAAGQVLQPSTPARGVHARRHWHRRGAPAHRGSRGGRAGHQTAPERREDHRAIVCGLCPQMRSSRRAAAVMLPDRDRARRTGRPARRIRVAGRSTGPAAVRVSCRRASGRYTIAITAADHRNHGERGQPWIEVPCARQDNRTQRHPGWQEMR